MWTVENAIFSASVDAIFLCVFDKMKSGGFRKRISVDKALICSTRRMAYHRCSSIYKCVNDLTGHSLDIVRRSDIHSYNTRNKEVMNWGQPCCSIDPRLAV